MRFLIYLIAPPGSLRHSLSVLLAALEPGVQVHQYDTIGAALQQAPTELPGLIVLNTVTPGNDLTGTLEQLQNRWPLVRIVTLVDDKAQGRAFRFTGKIVTVTEGIAAARLRTLFNDLLCDVRNRP